MGRVEVSHEMVVSAPIEEAYAYLTTIDNYPEFISNMVEIRGHSGQLTDGATWQSVSKFMGREVASEGRVLELDAPNLFRYAARSNAGDTESAYELREVVGGTLVKHTASGEVKGFFATLAMGLLKRNVDKQFKSDMESLQQRLNSSGRS